MTPLEINAAGRPVVAFRAGGATETIVENLNGVFFDQPASQSAAAAILRLEQQTWDSTAIRAHAETYSTASFRKRILDFIAQAQAPHAAA